LNRGKMRMMNMRMIPNGVMAAEACAAPA
jgi:hypothetical protein